MMCLSTNVSWRPRTSRAACVNSDIASVTALERPSNRFALDPIRGVGTSYGVPKTSPPTSSMRTLLRQESPIDGQHGAGDEGGVVRGEEDDGARDFGRFADAAHRVHALDRREVFRAARLLREPLDPLGADRSGGDGVDPDPAVGPLDRQVLGQAGSDELGGAVSRLPLLAGHSGNRGEADDGAPAAPQHRLDRELAVRNMP